MFISLYRTTERIFILIHNQLLVLYKSSLWAITEPLSVG
nr:MAG TPA: hypothetical protein [Caudoviricetes sp.]